jgi:(R,R)-butanediol dehydrogenase/meso-butanediol dehydrogenase/diacetyl reductase
VLTQSRTAVELVPNSVGADAILVQYAQIWSAEVMDALPRLRVSRGMAWAWTRSTWKRPRPAASRCATCRTTAPNPSLTTRSAWRWPARAASHASTAKQPAALDLHAVFFKEQTIVGVRVYTSGDVTSAIELIASGALGLERFPTMSVDLSDVGAAFDAATSRQKCLKVLLSPLSGTADRW